jgi:hypothetical protein
MKKNEMDGAYGTYVEDERCIQSKLGAGDYFENGCIRGDNTKMHFLRIP